MKYGDPTDFCVVRFRMEVTVPVGFEDEAKAALINDMSEAVTNGMIDFEYLNVEAADEETDWNDVSTWVPGVPSEPQPDDTSDDGDGIVELRRILEWAEAQDQHWLAPECADDVPAVNIVKVYYLVTDAGFASIGDALRGGDEGLLQQICAELGLVPELVRVAACSKAYRRWQLFNGDGSLWDTVDSLEEVRLFAEARADNDEDFTVKTIVR